MLKLLRRLTTSLDRTRKSCQYGNMKYRFRPFVLPGALLLLACRDITLPATPTRLEISAHITELAVGDTALLAVTAYAGDSQIQLPTLQWTSSDSTIVSVNNSGRIRALSVGSALITATALPASASLRIGVIPAPPKTAPVLFSGPAIDTVQGRIAGGSSNACALSGKHAWCWGMNISLGGAKNTLGVADTAWAVTTPSPLIGDFQFQSLAAGASSGGYIRCGLTTSGNAVCWGLSIWGITPVPTVFASHLTFTTIAAGNDHVCGIDTNGVVYCWGWNESGELGRRTPGPTTDPQHVSLPEKAVAVAAGFRTSCALGASGVVYCWGMQGPLLGRGEPQGSIYTAAPPGAVLSTQSFARLYGQHDRYCALTREGEAHCWGDYAAAPKARPTTLRFRSLTIGVTNDCGLTAEGVAYCWGENSVGQLGTGNRESTAEPTTSVAGDYRFVAIAAVGGATCGITTSGSAHCWGIRRAGLLGDGYSWDRPLTQVKGNTTFTRLSAGIHTQCGITSDNRAYCWGRRGLWGFNGESPNIFEPTALPTTLRFRSVELGDNASCFLEMNGTAWCSGPPLVSFGAPQRVDAPQPFISISTSTAHGCGLTDAGEAYCWGLGGPELGAGAVTPASRLTALRVVTDVRFRSIDARPGLTCALALQGEVYCWGTDWYGRLGTAVADAMCGGGLALATPCTFTPKRVTGLPAVRELAATLPLVCAATESGEVYCWGLGGPNTCSAPQTSAPCQRTPTLLSSAALHGLNGQLFGGITALDRAGNVYLLTTADGAPRPLSLAVPFTAYAGQCGLTFNGSVFCSGYNEYGAVGDGILEHSPVPVPVIAAINFGS
jgi:alpha-tubulin suppressor-like RCC1 family protein